MFKRAFSALRRKNKAFFYKNLPFQDYSELAHSEKRTLSKKEKNLGHAAGSSFSIKNTRGREQHNNVAIILASRPNSPGFESQLLRFFFSENNINDVVFLTSKDSEKSLQR